MINQSLPIWSNSITRGSTPSLLNKDFTSDEYLNTKINNSIFSSPFNHTNNRHKKNAKQDHNHRQRNELYDLRAPSFGVDNHGILIDSPLHTLLQSRPERARHSSNLGRARFSGRTLRESRCGSAESEFGAGIGES